MSQAIPERSINVASFGQHDGKPVSLYTLRNANGIEVKVTNYGGAVVGVLAPDREGRPGDVVLGYDGLAGYERDGFYLGAITGRHANRIAGGKFVIDGQRFAVTVNNGPNHLHGGKSGFHKKVWEAEMDEDRSELRLKYVSPDGEEGFPGKLTAVVTYSLSMDNELGISYEACGGRTTVCSLSDHIYWNLSGRSVGGCEDHELRLFCDFFTPVDEFSVPTGEIRAVEGTAFDFREPRRIGDRIEADEKQMKLGNGYDHNFVIRGEAGELRPVARVCEPESGRVMEVFSTDHGVQFYTGNFLDGSIFGKDGETYERRRGFCLECQHFPDSVNRPEFSAAILRVGETYRKSTVYRFSTGG